jgi:hypothetical protein
MPHACEWLKLMMQAARKLTYASFSYTIHYLESNWAPIAWRAVGPNATPELLAAIESLLEEYETKPFLSRNSVLC